MALQQVLPIPVPLGPPPLAPWFRFGVIDHRMAEGTEPLAPVRVCRDFCLHLQLEGRSWLWCEALNGSVDVEPGDVLFIPPGFVHAWAYAGETHLAIHFDFQWNPALTSHNYEGSYQMISILNGEGVYRPRATMPVFDLTFPDGETAWRIPLVTRVENVTLWQERLGHLVYLWQTRKLPRMSSHMRVLRLLTWALDTLAIDADANTHLVEDARITALLRDIQDPSHLVRLAGLSVRELALHAEMGITAFREAFRAATGQAPHRYLRERQIQYAAHLLRQSTRSVAIIAATVGFSDPAYFSRVFHQRMGCSPQRFRAQEQDLE